MTVIVAHHKTKQQAIESVDHGMDALYRNLFAGVQIVNPVKKWDGSTMTFSVTGKLGFIEVPLAGTATVDDRNVTIECDLPPLVKNFVGEDKIRAGLEQQVKGLLAN